MKQFIIPFFYLTTLNGFYITIFKKKFEECLPISILSSVTLMIITGFIDKLSYGFYLTLLMITYFIIFTIYKLIKDKNYIKFIIEKFFTIGFIFFVILYIYIMLLHHETTFLYWDEFMHWGFMAKESFRLNAFYSGILSFLRVHKDYPPFSTVLEVLWCRLSGNYYSEPFTFRALSILLISFIIPIFYNLSKHKKTDYSKGLFIVLIFLFGQVIVYNDFFPSMVDSIYTDFVLGALCAYGMFSAYTIDEINVFNSLKLTLILISTILCKQMGLPFYLLIIFVFLIKNHKKINIKNLIHIILIIVIPFVFYKAWDIYITSLNLNGQFSITQIKLSELGNIMLYKIGKNHQIMAYTNFLNALFNRPILASPIKLNYVLATILLSLKILILEKIYLKDFKLSLSYLIGGIGYGFAMLLLYIFSFNDYEGPLLASYERYLGTYIYIGFMLIVFLFSNIITSKSTKKYVYIIIISLFISASYSNINKLVPTKNTTSYLYNPTYSSLINVINKNEIIYKKILIIAQYQNDIKEVAQYSHPFNDFYIATIGKPKYDGDINAWDISLEEFKNFLYEFDYLFISNSDEPFYNDFWTKITDLELLNNQFYKIIKENNILSFEYIN